MGALRIAITSSILGTGLVVGVLGLTTIGIHLYKVKSTVKTAGKLGDIDIEGELLVVGLEHLVAGVGGVHEVDTRTNVLAGALSDKLVCEGITAGGDAVGAAVVGTIDSAASCTSHGVGTERGIPRASGVAIGKAGGGVQPAPVGIEHDGGLLGRAATRSTLSPGEFGMGLGRQRANLLGRGSGEEESEREEGG